MLDFVGGSSEITRYLEDFTRFGETDLADDVERVKLASFKRQLMKASAELTGMSNDHQGSAEELVDQARAMMDFVLAKAQAPNDTGAITEAELARRWQVIPASELMQPPKPPTFLLGRMIRKPSLISFYGPPGALKTMLAYDLAVCVAAGIPWLPHLPSEPGNGGTYIVNGCPVLIMDMDNGKDRLQERIGALARGRGLSDIGPIQAVSLPNPPLNMNKRHDADILIEQALALKAGLIVIDNLGTASGGVDENSAEMIQVMSNLRYVAETTGAVVIIIHHSRKAGANSSREGDRLRGHSSIEASLDLVLLIERIEEDDDITVKSTKTRDNPVRPFVARFSFEDDEAGTLVWARLWHVEDVQPKRTEYKRVALVVPEILQALDHEPKQAELAGLLQEQEGISRPTAWKAIHEAVQSGAITEVKTGEWKTAPRIYRNAK